MATEPFFAIDMEQGDVDVAWSVEEALAELEVYDLPSVRLYDSRGRRASLVANGFDVAVTEWSVSEEGADELIGLVAQFLSSIGQRDVAAKKREDNFIYLAANTIQEWQEK